MPVPDASSPHQRSTVKGTITMSSQPSLRFPGSNPNHHLWNNHGTWWCHFTEHRSDFTKRRVRINLKTGDLHDARRRRDSLLITLCQEAA